MKILRYTLFFSYRCNKTCWYCDIPFRKENLDASIETVQKYFPLIDSSDIETYTLSGGEPGLISPSILDYIFNKATHPIKVNTNGLFISNGYYEKYYDKIEEVGYHPFIEPSDDINLLHLDEKVVIYQPITKQNYKNIAQQLTKYPNFVFNYIPYIRKRIFMGDEQYYMTQEDLKECQQIVCNYSNITSGSRKRILELSRVNTIHELNQKILCQNSGSRYVINFVDEKIHRCPESLTHSDSKPLNEYNIDLMKNKVLFERSNNVTDIACRDCYYYPTFTDFNIKQEIEKIRCKV